MNRADILIEADELLGKINNKNMRIYDATILFYRQEGDPTAHQNYMQEHIPGAAFFDHQDFSDPAQKYMFMVLPEEKLGQAIGNIGIDAESEVVVYTSDMLPSATRAWWVLHYAGHQNVRVLNGGLAAWKAAGGAVEAGDHKYNPVNFRCDLKPNRFASKEEVLAAIDNGAICTVNSLNADTYAKAHIQGSSLLPCTNLMEGMTAFASNDTLVAELQPEAEYKRVITYCGGGIAATVNAMAHLIAGNENVAVYDGSMDEWTGENLPINTSH